MQRVVITSVFDDSYMLLSMPPQMLSGVEKHVNADSQDQQPDDHLEYGIRNAPQNPGAGKRAGHNACQGNGNLQPIRQYGASLYREVDRHASHIHQEGDCGGRCHEGVARHMKPEDGGRADAALVADETAEDTGYPACDPGRPARQAQSFHQTNYAADSREHQRTSEDSQPVQSKSSPLIMHACSTPGLVGVEETILPVGTEEGVQVLFALRLCPGVRHALPITQCVAARFAEAGGLDRHMTIRSAVVGNPV